MDAGPEDRVSAAIPLHPSTSWSRVQLAASKRGTPVLSVATHTPAHRTGDLRHATLTATDIVAATEPLHEAEHGLLAAYLACWSRWARQPDHPAVEPRARQSLWAAHDLAQADTLPSRHVRELLREHAADLGLQFGGVIGTRTGATTRDVAPSAEHTRTVQPRSIRPWNAVMPVNRRYRARASHGYDDERPER
ncbi:hypothetical protein ACFQZ4_37275 [Catellatospora coxensis]